MRAVILIAISTAVASPAAFAQQRATQDRDAGTPQAAGEDSFIQKAVMSDSAEIALGTLAEQRSRNSQVKEFAADMVKDHGQSSKELREAIGGTANFPAELDQEHLAIVKRLGDLNGEAFDREYMRVMVREHEKAADLLSSKGGQTMASRGSESGGPNASNNTAVTDWASKTLPVVKSHLQRARELQRTIANGNASRSGNMNGGNMNGGRSDSSATTGGMNSGSSPNSQSDTSRSQSGGRGDSAGSRSSSPR